MKTLLNPHLSLVLKLILFLFSHTFLFHTWHWIFAIFSWCVKFTASNTFSWNCCWIAENWVCFSIKEKSQPFPFKVSFDSLSCNIVTCNFHTQAALDFSNLITRSHCFSLTLYQCLAQQGIYSDFNNASLIMFYCKCEKRQIHLYLHVNL